MKKDLFDDGIQFDTTTYILKYRKPILCVDMFKWHLFFKRIENRRVRQTFINNIRISTIFLGINHNFRLDGIPILFETMAFKNHKEIDCRRCSTWRQALKQHWDMVARMKNDNTRI